MGYELEDLEESLPAGLEAPPSSAVAFEAWRVWGDAALARRRAPCLRLGLEALDGAARDRLVVSWRALLASWADGRTVAPDDAAVVALHFVREVHEAPPLVVRAAARLLRACMEAGATSIDVLLYAAGFAWGLRDAEPKLSDTAWNYIIYAPWQTDRLHLRDLLVAVESLGGFEPGRTLLELVEARLDAGLEGSAREFMEAVALLQSGRDHLVLIESNLDFELEERVRDAHALLVRLADGYIAEGTSRIHAREIIKRAVEIEPSDRRIHAVETTVWDRPIDEAYRWTASVTHPQMIDREIELAIEHRQPHHARRLAEAVLVRRYDRLIFGSAIDSIPRAIEKFCRLEAREIEADPIGRRAAEHLAVLYVRTDHVTGHARALVRRLLELTSFTGRGARLGELREELELFYNRSDPYQLLGAGEALLSEARARLGDDERQASDEVQRWFADRFQGPRLGLFDIIVRIVTAPLVDIVRRAGDLPWIEDAIATHVGRALHHVPAIAGDLPAIARRAAVIRAEHGTGMRLMDLAREVTVFEPISAAGLASAASLAPPGLRLAAGGAELGGALTLAFRGIARVGAVFGRSVETDAGFRLLTDSFALGCSSTGGEGLLAYLSREKPNLLGTVMIGGVAYGATNLVEHLWTAPGRSASLATGEAIRAIARFCGAELSQRSAARMVPLLGAALSGVTTYTFVRSIVDAAIHIAARDELMRRVVS